MPTDATPHPSLAQLLLADDRDAVAGFRDAHADAVRAYCEQACPPQLREEAFEASFVDFLGRLQSAAGSHVRLEELLFKATRAAAAARFNVQSVVVTQSRWAPTGVDRPEPLAAEPEAAPVAAEPQPAAEAPPAAEPTAPPPPTPIPHPASPVVRVRRGGLLGAARKMTGGTPPSRRSQS